MKTKKVLKNLINTLNDEFFPEEIFCPSVTFSENVTRFPKMRNFLKKFDRSVITNNYRSINEILVKLLFKFGQWFLRFWRNLIFSRNKFLSQCKIFENVKNSKEDHLLRAYELVSIDKLNIGKITFFF